MIVRTRLCSSTRFGLKAKANTVSAGFFRTFHLLENGVIWPYVFDAPFIWKQCLTEGSYVNIEAVEVLNTRVVRRFGRYVSFWSRSVRIFQAPRTRCLFEQSAVFNFQPEDEIFTDRGKLTRQKCTAWRLSHFFSTSLQNGRRRKGGDDSKIGQPSHRSSCRAPLRRPLSRDWAS